MPRTGRLVAECYAMCDLGTTCQIAILHGCGCVLWVVSRLYPLNRRFQTYAVSAIKWVYHTVSPRNAIHDDVCII